MSQQPQLNARSTGANGAAEPDWFGESAGSAGQRWAKRWAIVVAGNATFRHWGWNMARALAARRRAGADDLKWQMRRGALEMATPSYHWSSPTSCIARDIYRLRELCATEAPRHVLDLGANMGAFSAALSLRWPNLSGAAVEPAAATFAYLERNLRRNPGLAGVRAWRAAVVAPGTASYRELTIFPGVPQANSLFRPASENGGLRERVPAIPLQALLAEFPGEIDLLKCDIEGGEYEVLLTATPEDLRPVRRLVLEYHELPDRRPRDLVEKMAAAGLTLVGLEPALTQMWFARGPDPHWS